MQNKTKITLFILGGLIILGALVLIGSFIMQMTEARNTTNLTPEKVLENTTYGTSSILPTESDVRKNIKYGPDSSRTGTLEAPTSLTWSYQAPKDLCWNNEPGLSYYDKYCSINGWGWLNDGNNNPLGAVEYCQRLEYDGVTISASTTPNIWRLPTEAELLKALADQFAPGGSGVGGFQNNKYYWSGDEKDHDFAWGGSFSNGSLRGSNDIRGYPFAVRCVR